MLTGEVPFKPLASASMYYEPNSRVQAYEDMLRGMRSWVSRQKPTDVHSAFPSAFATPFQSPVASLCIFALLSCSLLHVLIQLSSVLGQKMLPST